MHRPYGKIATNKEIAVFLAVMIGIPIAHTGIQYAGNNAKIIRLKDKLPDEGDVIIERIRENGSYTVADKTAFKQVVQIYLKEHPDAWKNILESSRQVDGYNTLPLRFQSSHYNNGPIDNFLREVADELSKDKESSMLFNTDTFVARVAKNSAINLRQRNKPPQI